MVRIKNQKNQENKNPSKEVQLKRRNMYPGDSKFGGSHTSDVDQRITKNVVGSDGKGRLKSGTVKEKTYTHFPEGHKSSSTTTSGSRTIETGADGRNSGYKKKKRWK